jgi:hypothetical protein
MNRPYASCSYPSQMQRILQTIQNYYATISIQALR